MGWFLSKKKKKVRTHGRQTRGVIEDGAWDPARTLAGLQVLGLVLFLGGIVVGWPTFKNVMEQYATKRDTLVVARSKIVLMDKPGWLHEMPDVMATIRSQASRAMITADLSGAGLGHAVAQLEENPWISRVDHVQRLNNGQIQVYASYREPVVFIVGGRGIDREYRAIDRAAVVLPLTYNDSMFRRYESLTGKARPLMVLEGALDEEGVLPGVGERVVSDFEGSGVQAGIELAQYLQRHDFSDQVRSIDVSYKDVQGRVALVLWTGLGRSLLDDPHVLWGAKPSLGHAVEPDADVKLSRLASIFKRYQKIDAGGKIILLNRSRLMARGFGRPSGLLSADAGARAHR